MKTSDQSKKCNYKTLEKYVNPACACHIYSILVYLFIFKLCFKGVKPLIHQSELRTKIIPFKEKRSFRFVVF